MTQDDHDYVWIYRLAPARAADSRDAYDETVDEINAADGCWSCLAQEAVAILLDALHDRFTAPSPPGAPPYHRGIINTGKCADWIQDRLDNELARIEHDGGAL